MIAKNFNPPPFRPTPTDRPGVDKNLLPQAVDRTRVNERIRCPEVLVIGNAGEQLGVMKTFEAQDLARSQGLDLVEVSPTARPPVCRIMDYGKLKYEKKKKEKENRKNTSTQDLKEIQLRPNIEDHDFEVKLKKMVEILDEKDKIKVQITFQGREMQYARQHGQALMQRVLDFLKDSAQIDSPARLDGKRMIMILSPKK